MCVITNRSDPGHDASINHREGGICTILDKSAGICKNTINSKQMAHFQLSEWAKTMATRFWKYPDYYDLYMMSSFFQNCCFLSPHYLFRLCSNLVSKHLFSVGMRILTHNSWMIICCFCCRCVYSATVRECVDKECAAVAQWQVPVQDEQARDSVTRHRSHCAGTR